MNNKSTLRITIVAILGIFLLVGAGFAMATGINLAPHTGAASALYSPDTVTGIYASTSPAVVEITVSDSSQSGRTIREGQGSGFLVDAQGHIVTNNHVVAGSTKVQVMFKNGNSVNATVVGTDAIDDLAVISVDPSAITGITPLVLADSSLVKPGQMAIAIGTPFGLNDSITVGVISSLNRNIGGNNPNGMLQTDAAINPGNSGGPLLNDQGQVIGVNTAVEAASGARGIGFAVPSNAVTRVLPVLLAGKTVVRPFLGISGTALTASNAQNLGILVNQGVYVLNVVPNSPAAKTGLKGSGLNESGGLAPGGDVITAVDSKAVASVDNLTAYLITKQVGDTVTLTVLRGGQSMSVQVTLDAFPTTLSTGGNPQPRPNIPAPPPRIPGHGRLGRGAPSQNK